MGIPGCRGSGLGAPLHGSDTRATGFRVLEAGVLADRSGAGSGRNRSFTSLIINVASSLPCRPILIGAYPSCSRTIGLSSPHPMLDPPINIIRGEGASFSRWQFRTARGVVKIRSGRMVIQDEAAYDPLKNREKEPSRWRCRSAPRSRNKPARKTEPPPTKASGPRDPPVSQKSVRRFAQGCRRRPFSGRSPT